MLSIRDILQVQRNKEVESKTMGKDIQWKQKKSLSDYTNMTKYTLRQNVRDKRGLFFFK